MPWLRNRKSSYKKKWVPYKQEQNNVTYIDKIDPKHNYTKKKYLTTHNEKKFYFALQKAVPRWVKIHCQTSMAALLDTDSDEARRKIWAKRVDFVLTDSNSNILAIIELDDSSHLKEKRVARDMFVNEILTVHNLVRFKSEKFYYPENIKETLSAFIPVKEESTVNRT